MALTFEIDLQLGLIAITRSHNPTFDEWRMFMEELLTDPQFRPGLAIVEDRRGDRTVPSRNDVEIGAAWIRTNATRVGQSRWAVVLDPTSLAALGMVVVAARQGIRRHAEGYEHRDSGDYLQHGSTIGGTSASRKAPHVSVVR